jgi:hypothetical protein
MIVIWNGLLKLFLLIGNLSDCNCGMLVEHIASYFESLRFLGRSLSAATVSVALVRSSVKVHSSGGEL